MSFMHDVLVFVLANPDCDLPTATKGMKLDPKKAADRNRVSRTLGMLVFQNKLQRNGMRTMSRWRARPGISAERRKPGPAPKSFSELKPKDVARPVQAKPARPVRDVAPVVTRAAPPPPRNLPQPPKPPADCPSRASLVRAFAPPPKQRGSITSDQLAADVAAFLRRGGKIERLANGAASKPLRTLNAEASYAAVNERSWRERERRLARQETEDEDDGDLAAA